jgi:pimeloyl-ACP methyl ester carboxylesterase
VHQLNKKEYSVTLNNGVEVYCLEVGKGQKPVLVLPGWGAKVDELPFDQMFLEEVAGYLDEFKLYFLHLSNFYKSTLAKTPFTIEEYALEINQFLISSKLSEIDILGHSAGGRLAIHYQHKFPGKIRKLVLLNSAGLPHKVASDRMLEKTLHYFARKNVTEEDIKNLRQTFQNLYNTDLSDIIQKIDKKTLIIWGKSDQVINLKRAYLLNEMIKGSKLKIFDNLGHNTLLYSDVFKEIFEFLKQ